MQKIIKEIDEMKNTSYYIAKKNKELNEKTLKDRKTTVKIIGFSTWYLEIQYFISEPCPKGNFVGLRLGFEVPEHISPVRRCL